jgi:Asp-tRNA(Asn)/Glu-tRNA(Gln) amidotransferase A subunit family amidase
MPVGDELAFTPAHVLREKIARKEMSPVELAELTLRRIEKLNPTLNAFLTVTADLALDAARKAEASVMRGEPLGPLHGLPISIKDLEGVAGVRFTRGSLLHQDDVCDRDALCVERVRAAGAVIVGTTNTPEFGAAGTTENRLGPPCRNPWNPDRTPGGSSGGAAASVAAGITALAQGSDGGGSIRIPASFSGIYGIKATQGRVPRRHASLHSWHPLNNSSAGPMTRDVRDAAILLGVLAGPGPDTEPGTIQTPPPDFTSALGRGVRGLRIAWSRDFGGAPVDPEVVETCARAARAFDELGARVEETEFKPDEPNTVLEAFTTFSATKTYATHLDAVGREELLTDYFRQALERGGTLTAAQLFAAYSRIHAYRAYTREFFGRHDLLLSPTLAVAAFPIGQLPTEIAGRKVTVPRLGYFPFTYPFNVLGNPAATVPCGVTREGLPVGLQIVGRVEDELTVLAASAAFEEARPWTTRRPPVS